MDPVSQHDRVSREHTKVWIVFNDSNLLHKSSRKHPECPERVSQTMAYLRERVADLASFINSKDPVILSQETVLQFIKQIHGINYFDFVQGMWHEGINKSEMFINKDTYFMKETFKAACSAVLAALVAVDIILRRDFSFSFAMIRPPGHHSGMKSQPHGFSFLNNIAIAAEYCKKNMSKDQHCRLAIVDWDAHHGQGTQHIFYERKDVLFISMHRYDHGQFFPHIKQSESSNTGKGQGIGMNINISWNLPEKKKDQVREEHETCGDKEYAACFREIVIPVLKLYDPELILVSCGFDSGKGDPIGQLQLTEIGYSFMTRQLMKLSTKICMILEGGYEISVLKWGCEAVVRTLANSLTQSQLQSHELLRAAQPNKIGAEAITRTLECIRPYWKI